MAFRVAAEGGGTSASDEHDRGGLSDGCERQFEISDEANFCVGKCVCDLALHFFVGLGAADSGKACAEGFNFAEFDAGFACGGLCGLRESSSGGFVADAKGVRGAGARGGPDLLLGVEQDAFGFGAAAIETQDVLHGERILDFGRLVREWLRGSESGVKVSGFGLRSYEIEGER